MGRRVVIKIDRIINTENSLNGSAGGAETGNIISHRGRHNHDTRSSHLRWIITVYQVPSHRVKGIPIEEVIVERITLIPILQCDLKLFTDIGECRGWNIDR